MKTIIQWQVLKYYRKSTFTNGNTVNFEILTEKSIYKRDYRRDQPG